MWKYNNITDTDYLMHGRPHKYVLKIGSGPTAKYFYSSEEVQAYRAHLAGKKPTTEQKAKRLVNEGKKKLGVKPQYAKKNPYKQKTWKESGEELKKNLQKDLHNVGKEADKKLKRAKNAGKKKLGVQPQYAKKNPYAQKSWSESAKDLKKSYEKDKKQFEKDHPNFKVKKKKATAPKNPTNPAPKTAPTKSWKQSAKDLKRDIKHEPAPKSMTEATQRIARDAKKAAIEKTNKEYKKTLRKNRYNTVKKDLKQDAQNLKSTAKKKAKKAKKRVDKAFNSYKQKFGR